MPSYRIEDPLNCSEDAFWQLVFDPAFETQVDQASLVQREILEETPSPATPDQTVQRRCRITPQREWPAFITKALPQALTYLETQRFDPSTKRMEVATRTGVLPSKFEVSGILWAQPQADGTVLRIWEGQCRCTIPMLGRRIETAIIDQIRHTFAQSARVAQQWLS